MKKLLIVPILCLIAYAAYAITVPFVITVGTGDFAFTPLHTYYMAASGCSDANNGLSTSAPWCTPNHSVVCGDVILANTGSYSPLTAFGTVSSCPSTTGGIDGTGGIYVATLLCAGSNVGDCSINNSSDTSIDIHTSHWAVEGWKSTTSGNDQVSFSASTCGDGVTARIGYVAFINDIAYNSGQGFTTRNCTGDITVPGNGVDEWAVVGSIAQNANQHSICLAAIDFVGVANFDSLAGTHTYIAGNFGWANIPPSCNIDGEFIMLDTLDQHGYTGQVVVRDNIGYRSGRWGFWVFFQSNHTNAPIIKFYNNTAFGNQAITNGLNDSGYVSEMGVGGDPVSLVVTWTNNIAQSSWTHQGNTSSKPTIYAATDGGTYGSNITWGTTGNENIFKSTGVASCIFGGTCDAGFNVHLDGGLGANFYIDPVFKNTSDLITNHMGVPNCTGYTNVTACMGWNGSSVVANSVIDDLTPTAASAIGKGYRTPSACASDADYPTWLKGIVYLQANSGWVTGTAITQKAGLITKPCNM